jgi:endoribonuclease Nob1
LKAVILDTSAFIQGFNPSDSIEQYTTHLIYVEIHDELAKLRYEGARSSGILRERIPSLESLHRVEETSKKFGEAHILSLADKQILALALDLKTEGKETTIVTEDYSIQNMSQKLEITFQARGTQGIRKEIQWIIYCPGCKKRFEVPQIDGVCIICGTPLKRKPFQPYQRHKP